MRLGIEFGTPVPIEVRESKLCKRCSQPTNTLLVCNLKLLNAREQPVGGFTSVPLFHLCGKCMDEVSSMQSSNENREKGESLLEHR